MITPYRILFQISATAILTMLLYLALHLIPYERFVDIDYVYFDDVCVGSDLQTAETQRTVAWPVRAHVYEEVVKIEGVKVIETTVSRETDFGYESTGFVDYQLRWNEPLNEVGKYGVNSWVEIYPIPFITIKDFTSYKENQFNVIVCESQS